MAPDNVLVGVEGSALLSSGRDVGEFLATQRKQHRLTRIVRIILRPTSQHSIDITPFCMLTEPPFARQFPSIPPNTPAPLIINPQKITFASVPGSTLTTVCPGPAGPVVSGGMQRCLHCATH
jgi:hypothetical protein